MTVEQYISAVLKGSIMITPITNHIEVLDVAFLEPSCGAKCDDWVCTKQNGHSGNHLASISVTYHCAKWLDGETEPTRLY